MYSKELAALKRSGRFRERRVFDPDLIDLASNDYLGLAGKQKQLEKAVALVEEYADFAPKASMLVNGYHPIHKLFEEQLAGLNGFEKGIVVGSGFLANLSLIEALVRKGDHLFMDEEYHASGVLASQLLGDRVTFFRHNDADELRRLLKNSRAKRNIVAVEGVYSMSGELCSRDIFNVADEADVLLIVDEAHSSGILGERLLGIFEHYGIVIKPTHIKMGTLGKAYGSYGAYILANNEIISFLENRAKPIIYSTAPSVIDTALALKNIQHVNHKAAKYRAKIDKRLKIARELLSSAHQSLIVPISMPSNEAALQVQKKLIDQGFLIGAIRQPTVPTPILRVIPRLGVSCKTIKKVLSVCLDSVQYAQLSQER